jgi:hypothetical protein
MDSRNLKLRLKSCNLSKKKAREIPKSKMLLRDKKKKRKSS